MPPVITCDQVTDCNSWDGLFSICTPQNHADAICRPADTTDFSMSVSSGNLAKQELLDCYPGYDPGAGDSVDGLLGVYSTTAANASTLESTGFDTLAHWTNIDNAKSDNTGSYAQIDPTTTTHFNGVFDDVCQKGSEYIVLTGFGDNGHFDIPSGATVHGIAVGAKGHSYIRTGPAPSGITSYSAFERAYIWNLALMLNGVPYYMADPRTNALLRQVSTHSNIITLQGFVDCGQPFSSAPYPSDTCVGTSGLQVTFNSQPLEVHRANPQVAMPQGLSTDPNVVNHIPVYADTIRTCGFFTGALTACVDINGFTIYPDTGPAQKDMSMPTLKPTWTAEEVNDPSFGVAISVYSRITQSFVSTGGTGGNTVLRPVVVQQFLSCMGLAVYYTPGTVTPPVARPPNTFVIS